MTARERFRADVADALTNWRLGCIPPRQNYSERELYRAAIAEILELRLRIAYTPLFTGLERIKNRVGILADLREDMYIPRRPR
jgi:hypothetical protein